MGTLTTIIRVPPATGGPDPADNPNSLPLIGSHPLSSGVGVPAFEIQGVTYPADYARFTLADGQEEGGFFHIAVGKTPSAYIGQNRMGADDLILDAIDVAFRVRLNGAVPYKLFRSIVFAAADFSEAAVGHVWFQQPGGSGVLASDPARGVVGSVVQTTGYNDTANFIWEGALAGLAEIVDNEWHVVRVYHQLNTPGNADGISRVTIDGILDIEQTDINWVDSYGLEYGFNAFYLECFHNGGSPGGVTIDFKDLYVRGREYVPGTPAITITTGGLPSVETGQAYSQALAAQGGVPGSYAWSITAGSLTGSGLSLDPATGVISGTATGVGTYNFTVQCADGSSTAGSKAFSIAVTSVNPGGDPDFEFDFSDYANVAAVVALPGFEDRSGGANGGISLATIAGEQFTKALRGTYNLPSQVDQEIGLTMDMDHAGWASSVQPREIWGHFRCRHSAVPAFSYSGPSPGGGPGGKYLFGFDQDQIGTSRFNIQLGMYGDDSILPLYAGNSGVDTGRVLAQWPAATMRADGWVDFWWHWKMDSPDGINEVYVVAPSGTYYSKIGTGVNTDPGASKYFRYLVLGANINTGTSADGMFRDYGRVRVYTTQPANWPGAVQPFHSITWDPYATFAAAVSGEGILYTEQGGTVGLISGLTGTPGGFTKAIRCTYLGGVGPETTAGIDVVVDQAATRQLREIWGRFYVRFSPSFTTVGPGPGNPDLKFLFLFDQDPNGLRRWEAHVGHFGSGFGQFIAGTGDTQGDATQLFDGNWEEVLFHARFGTDPAGGGTAIWTVRYNTTGVTRVWAGGLNATFASYYFNYVAILRNLNRGSSEDITCDIGPIQLFDEDPFGGVI